MKERLFVIASQRSIGKTWWIVGEKAGPRSRKYVKTWSFRTRADAVHLIEFHEYVARDARELMREAITNGWSLKPGLCCQNCSARRSDHFAFRWRWFPMSWNLA